MVRRQANVTTGRRRRNTTAKTGEPETNIRTMEVATIGSPEDDSQKDNKLGTVTSGSEGNREIGNQTVSKNLSRAQVES